MNASLASVASLLSIVLCLAPRAGLAQPHVGATELARAKTLLDLSRAEFSAEQFALLSRKIAAAESACAELATVTRAGQAAVAVTEGSTAAGAGAEAVATGGRALLTGAADLLPFLLLVWPSTAHAPEITPETPEVRGARSRMDESLKELAQAARQVEAEREAAVARAPKPTLERCLQACEGDEEARAAFCRTLPNKTKEQKAIRERCWAAISQSPQFCKNTCHQTFGR